MPDFLVRERHGSSLESLAYFKGGTYIMSFYWLLWIAFLCSICALPGRIKRFQKKREIPVLLEFIGTAALAIALVCYTIEGLSE